MRPLLFALLVYSSSSMAISEQEIRDHLLERFPLVEEAVLKSQAAKENFRAAEGEFDHKLKFESRNRIEDKYDNQNFKTTLERTLPWRGLNLYAGHRQGVGTFPAYDGKFETSGAGEIFAGLSVPILRNAGTDDQRTGLIIARIEKKQAEEEVRLKKNFYLHKALSLYLKFRLESRKLAIRREILALAEKRHDMLDRRYRAGDVERVKLTDNQRTIEKRRDELLKSEVDLSRIIAELSLYVPVAAELRENPMDEKVLVEKVTRSAPIEKRPPQLTIAELEIEKLRAIEALYEQARKPGLSVDLLGAKELSANEPYDPERLQVAVRFDYPLENRKASGKAVAQSYKVQAIEKQREFVGREIERLAQFSADAASKSLDRWKTVSREYDHTAKMAMAEKMKWSQGSSDLFIVNLREQDVADSDIRRWTALYETRQFELDQGLYTGNLVSY